MPELSRGDASRRVGLIAGWGRYPILIAQQLIDNGYEVHCLGIRDHADPCLEEMCHGFRRVGIAKIGQWVSFLRRRGIYRATMAGKLFKHLILFQGLGWIRHLPDWTCIRIGYPSFIGRTKDCNDDTILGAFVDGMAQEGITLVPATDFAPQLLVKQGNLSHRRVTRAQQADIRFGWHLAKEMGRLDVGQTVVVKGQAVIAVEAVEGTDECIRRAGQLCPQGGFTVVKVAKPNQDMRFDVPTIGRGTLMTIVESGGAVLAVEAGKTVILDQQEVVQFADRHRVAVLAVDQSALDL